MRAELQELSPDSKVWIYTANRKLSKEEQDQFNPMLQHFAEQWTAHKLDVKSCVFFALDYLLVLMADETLHPVSGCSIDSAVHFVQQLGDSMQVDFFNRKMLLIKSNDGVQLCSLEQLDDIKDKENLAVLNNLLSTKKEFDAALFIPFLESAWSRTNLAQTDFSFKL